MEFEVSLGNTDIIKAIAYSHVRNKAIWVMCIFTSLLINGVSIVGLSAMEWPLQESISAVGDFFIWLFGLFFMGLGLTVLSLVANPKWRKGRVGKHNIEINSRGIVESTDYNRSEIYWSSVHCVSSRSGGLYFLHSGADSFLIPRSSFDSAEAWRDFENLFFKYYGCSRSS